MLKKDGDFIIYKIQHLSNSEWHYSSFDHFFVKSDEYHSFLASGECWQTTNIIGVFDVDIARIVRNQLAEKYKDYKFRVVKITISQKTEEVCR
jgi:hypothetical protein